MHRIEHRARWTDMRQRPLWLLLVAVSPVLGCRAPTAVPVNTRFRATQKDVILYEAELARPVEPATYRELAEREVRRFEDRAPAAESTPLYEVRVEFRNEGRLLATVLFRRDEKLGRLLHTQTFVQRWGMLANR